MDVIAEIAVLNKKWTRLHIISLLYFVFLRLQTQHDKTYEFEQNYQQDSSSIRVLSYGTNTDVKCTAFQGTFTFLSAETMTVVSGICLCLWWFFFFHWGMRHVHRRTLLRNWRNLLIIRMKTYPAKEQKFWTRWEWAVGAAEIWDKR